MQNSQLTYTLEKPRNKVNLSVVLSMDVQCTQDLFMEIVFISLYCQVDKYICTSLLDHAKKSCLEFRA